HGGYGFGERVAALLGSRASADTTAIVQHILRATNPKGLMQAARFGASGRAPPPGAAVTIALLVSPAKPHHGTPVADNAARLVQAVPQARLAMLDGCGHLPELEDPARVNVLVREFLSSRPA